MWIATATTNVGGGYLFTGLPAGSYEVKIAPSNFTSGKPLDGATYSTANIGSNSGIDSNFTSSTGKAVAVITNASNLTVDAGFRLPVNAAPNPGAQQAVITVSDNKNSVFELSLVSTVGNTWTYRVREVSGHNLVRWNLGITNCIDKIVSKNPTTGYAADSTGSSGFAGIRWDVDNGFSDANFSFTLNGSYPARSRQAQFTTANGNGQVAISGPDCSVSATATPTPTATPAASTTPSATFTPTPTATPAATSTPSQPVACSCADTGGFVIGEVYTLHEPVANAPGNFGWLRWSGDNTSAPDLEYNIRYPGESDVVHIGDFIKATTGQTNSSGVANALEQWIGKIITIPIYDQVTGTGSNTLYRVCAFAVFELRSWDRHTKTMTGVFVRKLIHSEVTDNTVYDLGARDVRMVQ